MKDIVVCCLWRRPEFFKVWTEQIEKADKADSLFFLFCLDYGYDPKHLVIIEKFPFECGYIKMNKKPYKLGKQSFNVLNGMMVASKQAKRYVYYVEDDIFVGKDYFTAMWDIHQKEQVFCSIGTRCNNTKWKTCDDMNSYYLTNNPDYQSWASCFDKDIIQKYIYPHFLEAYFTDPNKYCRETFPDSIIGNRWTEQDGLIRRIKERLELPIAYTHLPRAYHAGFYGYNRQSEYQRLPYQEKVDLIHKVAFNDEQMRKHCINYDYYLDSRPINLHTQHTGMKYIKAYV